MRSLTSIAGLITRELVPQRPHGRHATLLGLVEERVPEGEEAVPGTDGRSYQGHLASAVQPRLPPLGVDVGVGPEEGLEGRGLVPPDEQLPVGVAEEAAHVGPAEGHPGHAEGEAHGDAGLQVAPVCRVVSRPDGRVSLGSSVGRSGRIQSLRIQPIQN